MLRHIPGKPEVRNLVTVPRDLSHGMQLLIFLHLGTHQALATLPSFDGLLNLKNLTLVGLDALDELPSLKALKSLERLELLMLFSLQRVPSFAPLQKLSYIIVIGVRACCNGVLGGCELNSCLWC